LWASWTRICIATGWLLLDQITPLILTFNEEPNIGRVLEKLTWASEVVVLDSGSTDRTREIATSFKNVRWETRPFDSFAGQCNYALDQLIPSDRWVLSLDADYVLSDDFPGEIESLAASGQDKAGFESSFLYCIDGVPLRGCLYPPRTCLFRNLPQNRYIQDGHAHRLVISGKIKKLRSKILHDDRKPLSRWLTSQAKYGEQEAKLLLNKPWKDLRLSNRIRKFLVLSPFLAPLVYFIPRFGFLDGKIGLQYAFQRMIAELIISLKLLELRRNQLTEPLSGKPKN